MKNFIIYFLTVLFVAGCLILISSCADPISGIRPEPTLDSVVPDIKLITDGEYIIDDYRISEVSGDNITVKFTGFVDVLNSNYVPLVSVWGSSNGSTWDQIALYNGEVGISGYHENTYVNTWTQIKIYARLWTDETPSSGSQLLVKDIVIE